MHAIYHAPSSSTDAFNISGKIFKIQITEKRSCDVIKYLSYKDESAGKILSNIVFFYVILRDSGWLSYKNRLTKRKTDNFNSTKYLEPRAKVIYISTFIIILRMRNVR